MSTRDTLYSPAQRAALEDPNQPFVIGEELEALIALVNKTMRYHIAGVILRMDSPHDLEGDREPLTPGVRRLILAIENPKGVTGIEDLENVSLVFMLYVIGKGPNIHLDAEHVLKWVARVEQVNCDVLDSADDINDPAVLRGLVRSRHEAKLVSTALLNSGTETNRVADEVRAAVANPACWSPIKDNDIVVATWSLYRKREASA